jgi:hypothetical protein
MKKIIIALFLLGALSTNAQTYNPFKLDIAAGWSVPNFGKVHSIGALEPKFAPYDNFALGVRIEGATLSSTGNINVSGMGVGSVMLTGDYYFKIKTKPHTTPFRPFAGAGMGIYDVSDPNKPSEDFNIFLIKALLGINVFKGIKFGGFPRVGVEYWHFRLAVEYNILGKSNLPLTDGGTVNASVNYWGIKLGLFLGGGRKRIL